MGADVNTEYSEKQSTATSPPAFRRRLHITVALWGNEFIDIFERLTSPALLAPGNLAAIQAAHECSFHIHTRTEDAARLRASSAIAAISKLMPVFVDDAIGGSKGRYDEVSMHHRRAIAKAEAEGAGLVFIAPDQLWSDHALATLADLASRGVLSVSVPSLRVLREEFIAQYISAMREANKPALSGTELARTAIKALHPITEALIWDSPEFSRHPSHILWPAGPGNYLMRAFHLHPIMIIPLEPGATFHTTIDDDYIAAACPNIADHHVVTDTAEMLAVELSPPDKIVGNNGANRASPLGVATWAELYTNDIHRHFFLNAPILIPSGELDDREVAAARRKADETAEELKRIFSLTISELARESFLVASQRATRHFRQASVSRPKTVASSVWTILWLRGLYIYGGSRRAVLRVLHIIAQPLFRLEEMALSAMERTEHSSSMRVLAPGARVGRILLRPPAGFTREEVVTQLLRMIYSTLIGEPPRIRLWSLQWLRLSPLYARLVRIVSRRRIRALHVGFTCAPCRRCFDVTHGAELISMDSSEARDVDVCLPPLAAWPFQDGAFDMVLYTATTYDHETFVHVVAESGRALRRHGEFLISFPVSREPRHASRQDFQYMVEQIHDACRHSFDIVELDGYGGGCAWSAYRMLMMIRKRLVEDAPRYSRKLLLPLVPLIAALANSIAVAVDRIHGQEKERAWMFIVALRRL